MDMKENSLLVSPSILASDFSDPVSALEKISQSGADYVHLDVMDGMFVPNITFGPKYIGDLRKRTDLVFDTHLMIMEPERYIRQFAEAGSDIITVHQEATRHLHRCLAMIKEEGKEAGVAINPATPVEEIVPVLDMVDYVLVMSVDPGFGGQKFIRYSSRKIGQLDSIRRREGYQYLINVDGGINENTVHIVAKAGVDMVVTGSAFFSSPDPAAFVENLLETAGGAL